jgi:hypothetical protein
LELKQLGIIISMTPMKALLILALLTICGHCEGHPKEFDRLETTKGKVYEKVKVRKVEPDGISIMHDSGTAKVPFEHLSDELKNAFGYDEDKAAEHREAQAERDRKNEAAVMTEDPADVAIREAKEADSVSKQSSEEETAFREKVDSLARKISVSAFQNSDVGLIGTINVQKLKSKPVRGSMIKSELVWVHDAVYDGVAIGTAGAKVEESIDATGRHLGLRDTHNVSIEWKGKGWRIGSIQYKTRQGLLRTCPLFTGSIDDAVAFYRKHGFTKEAASAVRKAD